MRPRICVGEPLGSEILLKAIHWLLFVPPADWSNFSVVSLPTLRVFQWRMACAACCLTVTTVRPAAVLWVGRFAPVQSAAFSPGCGAARFAGTPGATCRPPGARPLGTFGRSWPGWFGLGPRWFGPTIAAARAAACMASTDFSASVVRARVSVAFLRAWLVMAGFAPKAVGALPRAPADAPPRRRSPARALAPKSSAQLSPSRAARRQRSSGRRGRGAGARRFTA